MKKASLPTKLILLAAALWAVPWAWLMVADVRSRTAIGRGQAGAVDVHEAFELVFVAAHYGVRLLAGWGLLAGFWLAVRYVLARTGRGVRPTSAGTARGVVREAVAGD